MATQRYERVQVRVWVYVVELPEEGQRRAVEKKEVTISSEPPIASLLGAQV